ncbi:P-type conjugative transfer ATPase TrbB [Paraphotobacterium marinum]|uniref:P-type conjugative transfer ATPase TrbB n=1 Tax=Paraphotobacterium marinum TaxID=1755811 RepID=A0A220VHV7_9GAMM|nr:P-type conjugative transfer ATPase TrbB [Paraphotobacterium marinum]ASK79836.1 P-type conjugative transfer ATPase TrbB [Paraphotobacterium marinum]
MAEIIESRFHQMLQTAFGPDMMRYFDDPDVIEIMLNPDGKIFIETLHNGKVLTPIQISSIQSESIIKLVASFKNQISDKNSPIVSSEIPFNGARFQGWLPPIVENPCFSIRKRALKIFSLQDYLNQGILKPDHYHALKKSVLNRKNILVVGGTGSGKTTFSNALLAELQNTQDRILVLEDLPELQVNASDVVNLITSDNVTMRDLVKGSLRMRPDRIIIGEVRDGCALDLLKSWNTGHPGGICTLHANSAQSAPSRLEDLIQEVVANAPINLIVEAIDLIVFIERVPKLGRKIENIYKLEGYSNGKYQLSEI